MLPRGDKTFKILLIGRRLPQGSGYRNCLPLHLPVHPIMPPRLQSTQLHPQHLKQSYPSKPILLRNRLPAAADVFVLPVALFLIITSECTTVDLLPSSIPPTSDLGGGFVESDCILPLAPARVLSITCRVNAKTLHAFWPIRAPTFRLRLSERHTPSAAIRARELFRHSAKS